MHRDEKIAVFDPFDPELLWGEVTSFSNKEKKRRESYIDLVFTDFLPPPRREWLVPRTGYVTGDAKSLIATSIYNALSESRSFYQEDGLPAGGLGQILDVGEDAELWI